MYLWWNTLFFAESDDEAGEIVLFAVRDDDGNLVLDDDGNQVYA